MLPSFGFPGSRGWDDMSSVIYCEIISGGERWGEEDSVAGKPREDVATAGAQLHLTSVGSTAWSALHIGSTSGLGAGPQAEEVQPPGEVAPFGPMQYSGRGGITSQPSQWLGKEKSIQKEDIPEYQQYPLHLWTALICILNSKHFLEILLKFCLQLHSL